MRLDRKQKAVAVQQFKSFEPVMKVRFFRFSMKFRQKSSIFAVIFEPVTHQPKILNRIAQTFGDRKEKKATLSNCM